MKPKTLTLAPMSNTNWHFSELEKLCLDLSILIPKPREDIYMFVVDRKCTPTHAKALSRQLFADLDADDYIAARQRWIDEEWFGVKNRIQPKPVRLTKEERQELAELMMDKFLKSPDVTDPTMLKRALDFALDKVEENREERARLYVPLKCTICSYREFCETNGEIVCPKCRYKQFARENGCEEIEYNELLVQDEK